MHFKCLCENALNFFEYFWKVCCGYKKKRTFTVRSRWIINMWREERGIFLSPFSSDLPYMCKRLCNYLPRIKLSVSNLEWAKAQASFSCVSFVVAVLWSPNFPFLKKTKINKMKFNFSKEWDSVGWRGCEYYKREGQSCLLHKSAWKLFTFIQTN